MMHSAKGTDQQCIILRYCNFAGSDYLLTHSDGTLDSDTSSACTMVHIPDNNVVEETKLVELMYSVDPAIPNIIVDQNSTQIQVLDNDGNISVLYFIIDQVFIVAAFMIITSTRMIEEAMDLMACVLTTAELAKSIAVNITAHSTTTDTASGTLYM